MCTGKVVIDAFRLTDPRMQALGQEPRQTTSNLGHLQKPSIQVCTCVCYVCVCVCMYARVDDTVFIVSPAVKYLYPAIVICLMWMLLIIICHNFNTLYHWYSYPSVRAHVLYEGHSIHPVCQSVLPVCLSACLFM